MERLFRLSHLEEVINLVTHIISRRNLTLCPYSNSLVLSNITHYNSCRLQLLRSRRVDFENVILGDLFTSSGTAKSRKRFISSLLSVMRQNKITLG